MATATATTQSTLSHAGTSKSSPPSRTAGKVVRPERYLEGAGFPVNRPVGGRQLNTLDPFLLLDHFGPITYGPGEAVGAPWHPHRGFQTVSYMLQGELRHQDSLGNKGDLRAGDVQWMTAGAGIIHDEAPSQGMMDKGGTMEGFQLWVNLPKAEKMCRPDYQDVASSKIPEFKSDSFTVRVIAGEAFGLEKAAVHTRMPVQYLDFHCRKDARFTHTLPKNMNVAVYVYRGAALFGTNEKRVEKDHLVLFEADGDGVAVKVDADDGAKFLLLAGVPLNEPVAKHGPFVMNTREEIAQAFEDYASGRLATIGATITSKSEHESAFDPKSATIV